MSKYYEDVHPDTGCTFIINVENELAFETVREYLLNVEGVREVEFHGEVFPHEFTVYTDCLVKISTIEGAILEAGYHARPKEHLL